MEEIYRSGKDSILIEDGEVVLFTTAGQGTATFYTHTAIQAAHAILDRFGRPGGSAEVARLAKEVETLRAHLKNVSEDLRLAEAVTNAYRVALADFVSKADLAHPSIEPKGW